MNNEKNLRKNMGNPVLEYELRKEAELMILNSIHSKIRYNNTMRKKKLKNTPNKETIKALNEYEAMRSNSNKEYKTYDSFADLLKDLKISA